MDEQIELPVIHDPRDLNTWVEVSAASYLHNVRFFRHLVGPDVELAAVVKANAYGHGLGLVAGLAARAGADSFCVHSLDEALELRRLGRREEILVMGATPRRRLGEVVEAGLRQVVYDVEAVERLAEAARSRGGQARVHLKLETGTHRQGVGEEGLGPILAMCSRFPELRLEGAYTHFANIEDTTDHSYAHAQMRRFEDLLKQMPDRDSLQIHSACTAAVLLFPETHFDMVRLGIGQYGIWPSRETLISYRAAHPGEGRSALRPVLTWKTRVSQVKSVPARASVSYGCTYRTTRPSKIAILPIGYSDGYDRGLSNQAYVLVGGHRAPIRGRICMNLTMVDVTDVPEVTVEDEVVLLGRQGDEEISAEQLAAWVGTIPYEIVARIAAGIPRRLVDVAG